MSQTEHSDHDGPEPNPYDEEYHHWKADGQLVVRGYPVEVECDCGETMDFDGFYGGGNEQAQWFCDCGLDFATAPRSGDPGNWRSWADRGQECIFTRGSDGEFDQILQRERERNLVFTVRAPTMEVDA